MRFYTYLFVMALVAVSVGAQAKPLGKMVDIGTGKMYIDCTGKGSPTVVLDAGAGAWSIHWTEIQSELEKTTRVCSYDRIGLGRSSGGTMPRTAKQAAIELNQLLQRSGEKSPFLLAGHSYGGYVARIYFDMFPKDVAGIALIDSAHEAQWKRLPAAGQILQFGIADFKEMIKKARSGQLKQEEFFSSLPKDLLPVYQRAMMEEKTQDASLSEIENAVLSAEQTGKTRKLDSLPLFVLSAGNSFASFVPATDENKPMLESMNKGWMEMQNELAALSTASVHLISQKDKHSLTNDNPKLVIYSVLLLIDKVRNGKNLRTD